MRPILKGYTRRVKQTERGINRVDRYNIPKHERIVCRYCDDVMFECRCEGQKEIEVSICNGCSKKIYQ